MDVDTSRRLIRDGSRVVHIDEAGWPAKLAWAETDAPDITCLRASGRAGTRRSLA